MAERFETHWQIPAQVGNIERVITEANVIFDRFALESHDRFGLNLLVWEALTNAVLHGCAQQPAALVDCRLRYQEGPDCKEVVIEVTDPGPGFDWQQAVGRESASLAPYSLPEEPLAESGRGLMIYLIYATRFEFNPAGNRVTLHRELDKGRDKHE